MGDSAQQVGKVTWKGKGECQGTGPEQEGMKLRQAAGKLKHKQFNLGDKR